MNGRMTKTGLFLMELLLVILFFSIASAVCLRMFAAAGLKSRDAVNLSESVVAAQTAAESFRAAGGSLEKAAVALDGVCQAQTVTVCYDAQWMPAEQAGEKGFVLTLKADGAVGEILVCGGSGQKALYALTVRVPGGDGS